MVPVAMIHVKLRVGAPSVVPKRTIVICLSTVMVTRLSVRETISNIRGHPVQMELAIAMDPNVEKKTVNAKVCLEKHRRQVIPVCHTTTQCLEIFSVDVEII